MSGEVVTSLHNFLERIFKTPNKNRFMQASFRNPLLASIYNFISVLILIFYRVPVVINLVLTTSDAMSHFLMITLMHCKFTGISTGTVHT